MVALELLLFHEEIQPLFKNDDYYFYRPVFKKLSHRQQKLLAQLGQQIQDEILKTDVRQGIVCVSGPEKEVEGGLLYIARVNNIYFGRNKIELKLPDGSYTKPFEYTKARLAYNSVSPDSVMGAMKTEIVVRNNTIYQVRGLDEMIDRININHFERIMVKIKNQGQENESGKIAYPSEYRLKKLIHEYLRENQSSAFRIAEFAEPRQEGRTKKNDARKKQIQSWPTFTHLKRQKIASFSCGK